MSSGRLILVGGRVLTAVLAIFMAVGCADEPIGIDASLIHIPAPGESADGSAQPHVGWDRDSVDVGLLAEGRTIETIFNFTNTGDAPLIISQVNTSCACTAARDWPVEPVAPGAGGSIRITLETRGKRGAFVETTTVVTNARGGAIELVLTGEVLGPDR
jgi:hypothetical protein